MEVFFQHPQWPYVIEIYNRLKKHNHKLYLAGGCVRDALMGRRPKDFDFASSATPEQIQSLFSKTIDIGKDFGTIVVVLDNHSFEITRFRKDLDYKDSRRPSSVEFSDEKEDALRRDFTMNSLFYDLRTQQVIDYCNGEQDIIARRIRFVGNAADRINEDHLRALRALRFVAQLDFDLDSLAASAIQNDADKVKMISRERVRQEWEKLLQGKAISKALVLAYSLTYYQSCFVYWKNLKESELNMFLNYNKDQSLSYVDFVIIQFLLLKDFSSWKEEIFFDLRLSKKEKQYIFLIKKHIEALTLEQTELHWNLEFFNFEVFAFFKRFYAFIENAKTLNVFPKNAILIGALLKEEYISQPVLFLSSEELIALGVPVGREISEFKNKLLQLQVAKNISTKSEAIDFVKDILKNK